MRMICRSLLLIPVLLVASCSQKSPEEPILVGHISPLSGPDRAGGEHARNGILLAVEEANVEDNRVHGRRVAVVHADSRGDPESAQAETVRLATIGQVTALFGGNDPAEAERIARTAQSYGLPIVALSALPTLPSSAGVLSLGMSPAQQGRTLGLYTASELKPDTVAVVTDGRVPAYVDLATAFIKEFRSRPEEMTYQKESEFPELVKRLKRQAPKAILIAAPPRDFIALFALLRDEKLAAQLIYGGPEGELALLQTDRIASEGVFYATTYLPEVSNPANQDFVKRYRERFQEPPDATAALAYDGARLLFDAMRRSKTTIPGEVRKELSLTEKFDSLTGPVTFEKGLHAIRPVFIARIEAGQPKLIKTYEPQAK